MPANDFQKRILFIWTRLCLRYVTLMENRVAYLRVGIQVMSACLVDVSVAVRVAVVPWIKVCCTQVVPSQAKGFRSYISYIYRYVTHVYRVGNKVCTAIYL